MRRCRVEEDRVVMCRGWECLWDQNKHAGGRCRVQEDRSVTHEGGESVCPRFVYIADRASRSPNRSQSVPLSLLFPYPPPFPTFLPPPRLDLFPILSSPGIAIFPGGG